MQAAGLMTSEELRALLAEASDHELRAVIGIAETILASRRRGRDARPAASPIPAVNQVLASRAHGPATVTELACRELARRARARAKFSPGSSVDNPPR